MVMDFPRRFINEAKAAHVGWGIKRKRKETRRKMKFKEMDNGLSENRNGRARARGGISDG